MKICGRERDRIIEYVGRWKLHHFDEHFETFVRQKSASEGERREESLKRESDRMIRHYYVITPKRFLSLRPSFKLIGVREKL